MPHMPRIASIAATVGLALLVALTGLLLSFAPIHLLRRGLDEANGEEAHTLPLPVRNARRALTPTAPALQRSLSHTHPRQSGQPARPDCHPSQDSRPAAEA